MNENMDSKEILGSSDLAVQVNQNSVTEALSSSTSKRHVVLPILPPGALQIVLDYEEVNAAWMTKFYKQYENILYTKTYQGKRNCRPKYIYKCLICKSEVNYFQSIKSHLSKHLQLYHIKCKYCDKIFNWPGNHRSHTITYHSNMK